VRVAAAQALDICCPNDSPVVEVSEPETPETDVPEGVEQPQPEGTAPEASAEASLAPIQDSMALESNPHLAPTGSPHGVVIHVDSKRRAAHVHFEDRTSQVPVGSILMVITESDQGQSVIGRMRVYESLQGCANVQELDPGIFDRIVRGTRVMAEPKLVALGNPRL
jgi:hypothetical protein